MCMHNQFRNHLFLHSSLVVYFGVHCLCCLMRLGFALLLLRVFCRLGLVILEEERMNFLAMCDV